MHSPDSFPSTRPTSIDTKNQQNEQQKEELLLIRDDQQEFSLLKSTLESGAHPKIEHVLDKIGFNNMLKGSIQGGVLGVVTNPSLMQEPFYAAFSRLTIHPHPAEHIRNILGEDLTPSRMKPNSTRDSYTLDQQAFTLALYKAKINAPHVMVADAYREINSIIGYNIDQDILKKKFQDTYMTLSHADKKILNQGNDHMKQLIEKDDIDEAFSLRLIFQLAALGGTFLAGMARENYRTGNSKVEEISPMQKEKIMLMSKIVTAEQIFSQTQRGTFDYRKVDQESIDTSTYTGEFISRLASFGLTLDDFFAIKKDIFNVYAKGVLQASFDQEKIDIYTEGHNYAEVTLPPVDIKSYILSVDMKVLQESILSRFLPTVLRPEARDEIVGKIVGRIRQEALNDTDGSITRLVSAAENQATFYFTNILQVATNSDSLVVDFNFNNETEHVLTGEHYHEEVLDGPNDIQGGTIDLRKDQ